MELTKEETRTKVLGDAYLATLSAVRQLWDVHRTMAAADVKERPTGDIFSLEDKMLIMEKIRTLTARATALESALIDHIRPGPLLMVTVLKDLPYIDVPDEIRRSFA